MQLLALRRRLALAQRGHKLLKDKLDGLVQRFFKLKTDFLSLYEELEPELTRTFKKAVFGTALSHPSILDEISAGDIKATVETEITSIMGVKTRDYKLNLKGKAPTYSTLLSASEFKEAEKEFKSLLPKLLKLAGKSQSIRLMAEQIIETRRRVNALEYVLIPELERVVASIRLKLSEFERSNQVMLLKIKDMVRAH